MSDFPRRHFIVGGQRSGKSRHAEQCARAWLAGAPGRRVTVVATALAGDAEMVARIEHHRRTRPAGFDTVEAPWDPGAVVLERSDPGELIVVDCLTLWVSQVLMPPPGATVPEWGVVRERWLQALAHRRDHGGPVVVVSNEIGWGLVPLGPQVRQVVDELGRLHQDTSRLCDWLTLMVAGQAWGRAVERV